MENLSKNIEILDGDNVQEMFRRGLINEKNLLGANALVNQDFHELVIQVHMSFMTAGATYITCNNQWVVPGVGFTDQEIQELTRIAGKLAVQAREEAQAEDNVKICGSLPPLFPSYRSDRTIVREKGIYYYTMISEALFDYVDIFLAESMSSLQEAQMAYEAVSHLQKPILISFAVDNTGNYLRSGEKIVETIEQLIEFTSGREKLMESNTKKKMQKQEKEVQKDDEPEEEFEEFVPLTEPNDSSIDDEPKISSTSTMNSLKNSLLEAILFNCSQPEDIVKALRHLHENTKLIKLMKQQKIRLGAYGNCISPSSRAGQLAEKLIPGGNHTHLDMEIYTEFTFKWITDYDAQIIGGCCGIGPIYISKIAKNLERTQQEE
jgi:S-methylmethionine-dependent homocysteine/selenocysteine methylase